MNKTLEFLKSLNIASTDYIIVGCSSGPDSMCLLNVLHENGYSIVCAHVNHNIRAESNEECDYLKKFCDENNIPFELLELPKGNIENEYYYRKKRYLFYKTLADKYKTKYIATAHHADDLIETILMRISRGSNLKGYLGFSKEFNEKGYIMLKPLIFCTKDEIIIYLKDKKIKYFIDATNDTDDYTRNRYRHNIIPFLKKENSQIHNKYLQYSNEIEKASKYINSVVLNAMNENYSNSTIDLDIFLKLDDYIKECELEKILSLIYGDDIDSLSKKLVTTIIEKLRSKKNFKLSLPKNYVVYREYNKLYINKDNKPSTYRYVLNSHNEINNEHIIDIIDNTEDRSNYTIRLNSKEIKLPLYIRNKETGDKIAVKNMNGTQKVKTIFIDSKMPPRKRSEYPLVVDANNTVLWIPGIKKSKFDNDIDKKYDIILKYTRKE